MAIAWAFLWRLCTDYKYGCGLRLSTSTLSCVPIVILLIYHNNINYFNFINKKKNNI